MFDLDRLIPHWIISGDIGSGKPDTAIFERAFDVLRVQPTDCVFVDDREVNVEAAAALGITALHFVPGGGEGTAPPSQPRRLDRLVDVMRSFTAP